MKIWQPIAIAVAVCLAAVFLIIGGCKNGLWISGSTIVTRSQDGAVTVRGLGSAKYRSNTMPPNLGFGAMKDYHFTKRPPWLRDSIDYASITSVTIGNGVTHVGSFAFLFCDNLTSVTFGRDVLVIGYGAFWGTGLTSLTLPNSLIEIEKFAFANSTSLISVTIPQSVRSIGSNLNALDNSPRLTSINVDKGNRNYSSVDGMLFNKKGDKLLIYPCGKGSTYTIPANVISILSPFDNCAGLTDIFADESNMKFTSAGGVLFNKDMTRLERYPEGKHGSAYTIPDGVTEIYVGAFYQCTGLTSVTIPNSVVEISTGAFSYCTSLTSITISNNMAKIGTNAFLGCTGLKSMTSLNPVPPVIENRGAFKEVNACLYVPESSISAYRTAFAWKDFECIKPLSEAPAM
ncbi:MAG: leucine-rich repeat domain-containing protein [Chitinispirillia bacterium]|nr:leucine-rich repeat domain-containing protein [Chitinispirillia bacterium]MCL2268012.1 leucine-rich repeat domain-containing protein [Chitinispirillia bacterium]